MSSIVRNAKSLKRVVNEIKKCNEEGPARFLSERLSIDRSEKLAAMLKRAGVKHVVLNAKYHEKGSRKLFAQAGR
jgi:preprotein translocase subunit SecA